MKRKLTVALLAPVLGFLLTSLTVLATSGCYPLQYATTNIEGWDISRCFEDITSFWVCYDLFKANETKITGGEDIINFMLDQAFPETQAAE